MAGQTSFADFLASTKSAPDPAQELSPALRALWYDAKGNWAAAHAAAQQDDSPAGAWVHAYLHRKEGDASNAAYWYHRARQPVPNVSLESEWLQLAQTLAVATR